MKEMVFERFSEKTAELVKLLDEIGIEHEERFIQNATASGSICKITVRPKNMLEACAVFGVFS